jgi:hypothetical protein
MQRTVKDDRGTPLSAQAPGRNEICLMLRAHAEQGWLEHEVLPVVLELHAMDLAPQSEQAPALAYLEAVWSEAKRRAAATDTSDARLQPIAQGSSLRGRAHRYHGCVCDLREKLAAHVDRLLEYSALAMSAADTAAAPHRSACSGRTRRPTRSSRARRHGA